MIDASMSDVAGVIAKVYEAAYDPAQWSAAIEEMRKLFDSSAACLANQSTDRLTTWAYSANPDQGSLEKYIAEYTAANPLMDALSTQPLKAVVTDHDLVDVTEFRHSRFWNDWMKPQDMYAGMACKIFGTQNSTMFIDIRRGANQSDFSRGDVELLSLLVPHFERAVQINQKMMLGTALTSTFSRLPFAAMLVYPDLRILAVNDLAETWMDDNMIGLRRRDGFVSAQPAVLKQLQNLVAHACSIQPDGVIGSGGQMVLESECAGSHAADYVVEVAPLFDAALGELATGRCAVIFMKKVHMGNPDGFDECIRSIFKLTRAETRLAELLAAGFSLQDAAIHLGVKNCTTRTYLERLFGKTGTHQQSQLVALLKNVAPALLRI